MNVFERDIYNQPEDRRKALAFCRHGFCAQRTGHGNAVERRFEGDGYQTLTSPWNRLIISNK